MPDLDEPTEKNEPAAKPTVSNGVDHNASTDMQAQKIKESSKLPNGTPGPELDDFGLPVKRYEKPASGEDCTGEGSPKERSFEGTGRGHEDLPQSRISSSHVDEATSAPGSAKEPLPVNSEQSGSATRGVADDSTTLPSRPSKAQSQSIADQGDPHQESSIPHSIGQLDERTVPEEVFLRETDSDQLPLPGASEWSHQQVVSQKHDGREEKREDDWQDMPAFAPYNIYDDNGKLVAREAEDSDDEAAAYEGLGGAGKGYTRVQVDEDAQSATSMDDNTQYLFKETKATALDEEDEEQRDPLAQMQATKDLLTEGQRIAYVGVTRLTMVEMVKELSTIEPTRATKKELNLAVEGMTMWSQKMMVRLYMHMEINSAGMRIPDE